MDAGSHDDTGVVVELVDLAGFALPVLSANAQELAAHEDVVNQIDKSSGGKTLWRKVA
jgi:DNA polymerase-3 subunit epsilon